MLYTLEFLNMFRLWGRVFCLLLYEYCEIYQNCPNDRLSFTAKLGFKFINIMCPDYTGRDHLFSTVWQKYAVWCSREYVYSMHIRIICAHLDFSKCSPLWNTSMCEWHYNIYRKTFTMPKLSFSFIRTSYHCVDMLHNPYVSLHFVFCKYNERGSKLNFNSCRGNKNHSW